MSHTGTPRPFKSRSLKVRLAQVELSRDELLNALDEINLAVCYGCEEDIDARYAMLLKIGEIARAAIARAKGTP